MTEVKRISVLQPLYGTEVELVGEDGQTEPYRIAAEFEIGGRAYAGLQTREMRKNDETAFFRISVTAGSEPELETIDDEDEWELAAEAYDDLVFGGGETP
ncbi:DUF1292 domain-containing protein [Paenibacillus humicola]|uniref:DUF1292 domain-containing protein n=1 Tax=Paenibacillus humicola TaxID=3110540 RepID=UPI00237C2322|nr:DUF1292 domain-containing protein [Paenibacillus humicola]